MEIIQQTHIRPQQAQDHGLPPLDVRLDARGSGVWINVLPSQSTYLSVSAPPGGTVVFEVSAWAEDLQESVRQGFEGPSLLLGEQTQLEVAGAMCNALGFITGTSHARTLRCAIQVCLRGSAGYVLWLGAGPAISAEPNQHPQLLSHPTLAALLRMLSVSLPPTQNGT